MFVLTLTVSEILKFYIFNLKGQIKVIGCKFCNGIIRCQIYKSIQVFLCFFALALNVSDILTLYIFYLQKVVQRHRVQFSQLHHSMTNVKIYEYPPRIFRIVLTISEIQKYLSFGLQKVGQSYGVHFCYYIIQWQMLKYLNVSETFLRQLLLFQRYQN